MDQINAPYNFVPLSDTVVIPEWGDKVSHDLPFRDGVSGELELTIEALAPIMVGGQQTQGTEQAAGQVHFFQTPDGKYAIPGASLRGVIRSVTEIATFSRMNRVDDKRFGLRDITGKYVADSYAGRVRNNVQYGFLQLNPQGKPTITPCKMVRLNHRDLETWWKVDAPVFAAGTTVKQKYEKWRQLCQHHAVANTENVAFNHNSLEVSEIGHGEFTGFPVFTGQINAEKPTDEKFGTKYKGRPKNKDFMFHSERVNETFIIDAIDKTAWRDFLFIHGDEDGKPDSPWKGFWKQRFWVKQKVPVFYIQGKGRLQIGLAYMPKLAGDFSIHDMLQHTHRDHVEDTKPDFAALLFGRVGEKPEDALKGRVYLEPAILQGQANIDGEAQATILNGAKPSYFPNYVYQPVDKSGAKLTSGQYATYVYSAGNPAPELRGWKRYPVRKDEEVKSQALQPDQEKNKKVQTRLYTLQKGSTFKGRLVFHNLKPQELGALLWALQFEGKRHSLGMGKSFGYGQVKIQLEWNKQQLVCNDPKQTTHAKADDYIDVFQQYMTARLGSDWRTSTPITALTAMADPACRQQFAGELKHMAMGKPNDFVEAKKAGFVLESYVEDKRKLKRSSHVVVSMPKTSTDTKYDDVVIEAKNEVWENAKIQYDPSKATLTATTAQGKAVLTGADAKKLMGDLANGEQSKAKKNQLLKSVSVEGKGNDIKIKAFV
jgi:CRISPR-associated protein (TIGR03986 family)